MNCKKCGQEFDNGGNFCPNCGTPAVKEPDNKKPHLKATIAFIVAAAIIAGGIGIHFAADNKKEEKKTASFSEGEAENDSDTEINKTEKTEENIAANKNTGDIVEFGSYPQSKVDDKAVISALDGIDKNWISYEYYSGSGDYEDGKMAPSDYMKYADIEYNGEKYRAVTFTKYRPYISGGKESVRTDDSHLDENGYKINNIYYFKYEPLEWRVLDSDDGYIMCNSIIDSQAYNNYILRSDETYGDPSRSSFASNWSNSSIRKWLNDSFYNSAFSSDEQNKINNTELSTSCLDDSKYSSDATIDKVFLPSFSDLKNEAYGFNSDARFEDPARKADVTDYAKCQGCCLSTKEEYQGRADWWLRNAKTSYGVYVVCDKLVTSYYVPVQSTTTGVCPALKLK